MFSDNTVIGILQPRNALTEDRGIALATLTTCQDEIHVNNFTDHPYTLKRGPHVANLSFMTPK